MNISNDSGPNIDPRGTPHYIPPGTIYTVDLCSLPPSP